MSKTISACEQEVIAPNGVPIYYYCNPYLHSFCMNLYMKAGSLYEPDDWNGATHLWEHALYRKMNRLYLQL
jgi:predicted Zn-dependent peptidase